MHENKLHGFVEVVFQSRVILFPHVAKSHGIFAPLFNVEQHQVSNTSRFRFQFLEIGNDFPALGKGRFF